MLEMTLPTEIVLKVGGSGGSVTLLRWQTSSGELTWTMETNEVALYDLLESEDGFNPRDAVRRKHADSFDDAIKLLDKYPWPRLYPMEVHPRYREAILMAVLERAGAEVEKRWRTLAAASP